MYNVSNIDNYKQKLTISPEECISAFKTLLYKYFLHINLLNQEKFAQFSLCTLISGIDTLESIFLMLLLKSKNLPFVIHNSEKSIFYYFEFIEQIKKPNAEIHSLLNLSIVDAKMFIYKKILGEAPITSNNLKDSEIIFYKQLKHFTHTYKTLLNILLTNVTIEELINNIEKY